MFSIHGTLEEQIMARLQSCLHVPLGIASVPCYEHEELNLNPLGRHTEQSSAWCRGMFYPVAHYLPSALIVPFKEVEMRIEGRFHTMWNFEKSKPYWTPAMVAVNGQGFHKYVNWNNWEVANDHILICSMAQFTHPGSFTGIGFGTTVHTYLNPETGKVVLDRLSSPLWHNVLLVRRKHS